MDDLDRSSRILIVDDQPANVRLLEHLLASDGLRTYLSVTDPRLAEKSFLEFAPDLVLLDLIMRPIDGLQVLAQCKPHLKTGEFLPILVLTADNSPQARHRALEQGATDFLTKPLDGLEVKLRIRNLLRTRMMYLRLERQKADLESAVRERTREVHAQARLMDLATDAMIARDLHDRVIYWNKGAEHLYGQSASQVLGRNAGEVLAGESVQEQQMRRTLERQGEWSGEVRQRGQDGGEKIIYSRCSLVRDETGQPFAEFRVNTDITKLKSMERQLQRAQRLESVGALAAGIAHDLNNMLTPITMGVGLLRHVVKDELGAPLLDTIRLSADHGVGLVQQLLTFVRGTSDRPSNLSLPGVIQELVGFIRKTFPRTIEIEIDIEPDLPAVRLDVTHAYQILLNLAINARDAMPDGGTLTLRGSVQSRAEQRYVLLSVSDTGVGIPEEIRERIFEPFFTTKGERGGTGLGLSTTNDLVRSSGGFLEVESTPGRGSCFSINLPITTLHENPETGSDNVPEGCGELLLIVEDEGSIREVMRHTLEASNYRVLSARDVREAEAMLHAHRDEIAVVIADLVLPDLPTAALVGRFDQIKPGVPIVVVSADQRLLGEVNPVRVPVRLSKPFSSGQLLFHLRRVLEGTQP